MPGAIGIRLVVLGALQQPDRFLIARISCVPTIAMTEVTHAIVFAKRHLHIPIGDDASTGERIGCKCMYRKQHFFTGYLRCRSRLFYKWHRVRIDFCVEGANAPALAINKGNSSITTIVPVTGAKVHPVRLTLNLFRGFAIRVGTDQRNLVLSCPNGHEQRYWLELLRGHALEGWMKWLERGKAAFWFWRLKCNAEKVSRGG
eukprot:IDg19703t1